MLKRKLGNGGLASLIGWGSALLLVVGLLAFCFPPRYGSATAQSPAADPEQEALRRELIIAEQALERLGSRHPYRQQYEARAEALREKLKLSDWGGDGDRALPDRDTAQRVVTVQNDPRKLVELSDFELVGGWRIPAARQGDLSTAFSIGGLSIERVGTENRFWISHHTHLGGVLRLTGGQPGTGPLEQWPLLKAGDYVPVTSAHNGLFDAVISGVHWDDAANRLWVSGRSHYAVPPHLGPWLVACEPNQKGGWKHRGPYAVENTTMQRNGGGFCRISPSFANQFLAGRTLGLACGGYESGQGSSLGPTLTAAYLSPSQVEQGISLLGFGWNCDETLREYRFPDYQIKNLVWAIEARNDRGFWFAEEILGGPAWVETDQLQGLCYFVREGVGEVDYALQNQNFTKQSKSRMYTYSLNDLAQVAVGNRRPHEIHGRYEESAGEGLRGIPRGACFDRDSERLFVFLEGTWKDEVEWMPSIAVFKIADDRPR